MLHRLKDYFERLQSGQGAGSGVRGTDDYQLAAAALLVHAACVDTSFEAVERARILQIVTERLGVARDEAEELVREAENAVDHAVQILGFTRILKDHYDYDERVELMEMLWDVVHADGEVDAFEAQLMRRIAGLLYVTDKDSGIARRRVRERDADR